MTNIEMDVNFTEKVKLKSEHWYHCHNITLNGMPDDTRIIYIVDDDTAICIKNTRVDVLFADNGSGNIYNYLKEYYMDFTDVTNNIKLKVSCEVKAYTN